MKRLLRITLILVAVSSILGCATGSYGDPYYGNRYGGYGERGWRGDHWGYYGGGRGRRW